MRGNFVFTHVFAHLCKVFKHFWLYSLLCSFVKLFNISKNIFLTMCFYWSILLFITKLNRTHTCTLCYSWATFALGLGDIAISPSGSSCPSYVFDPPKMDDGPREDVSLHSDGTESITNRNPKGGRRVSDVCAAWLLSTLTTTIIIITTITTTITAAAAVTHSHMYDCVFRWVVVNSNICSLFHLIMSIIRYMYIAATDNCWSINSSEC